MNQDKPISIDKLFKSQKKIKYQSIKDEQLLEQKNFLLKEVYTFKLNIRSKAHSLFPTDDDISQAMILKLDNHYYLVATEGDDGYRNNRGDIYQVNFEKDSLTSVLAQHQIDNVLAFPLEVRLEADRAKDHLGIIISIKEFKHHTFIQLSTQDFNDYYPSSIIELNQSLLIEAIPFLEKKRLDENLNKPIKKSSSLKI